MAFQLPIADCRLPIAFPPRLSLFHSLPVPEANGPFSKAYARLEKFASELPAMVLVSLENSGAPAQVEARFAR
jgi:hypothetical protein